MDESILIERAKTDKEAFGQLYELYVDRIYSYVSWFVVEIVESIPYSLKLGLIE